MSKTDGEVKVFQRRRLRAGRLLRHGVAQAEVARRVSVSRATVSEWNTRLEAGGLAALKSRPRGRPARLDAAQRRELMRALTGGAVAEGFATDLWTLRRVGQLIERRFARPYSQSQVRRIVVSLGLPPLVPRCHGATPASCHGYPTRGCYTLMGSEILSVPTDVRLRARPQANRRVRCLVQSRAARPGSKRQWQSLLRAAPTALLASVSVAMRRHSRRPDP